LIDIDLPYYKVNFMRSFIVITCVLFNNISSIWFLHHPPPTTSSIIENQHCLVETTMIQVGGNMLNNNICNKFMILN